MPVRREWPATVREKCQLYYGFPEPGEPKRSLVCAVRGFGGNKSVELHHLNWIAADSTFANAVPLSRDLNRHLGPPFPSPLGLRPELAPEELRSRSRSWMRSGQVPLAAACARLECALLSNTDIVPLETSRRQVVPALLNALACCRYLGIDDLDVSVLDGLQSALRASGGVSDDLSVQVRHELCALASDIGAFKLASEIAASIPLPGRAPNPDPVSLARMYARKGIEAARSGQGSTRENGRAWIREARSILVDDVVRTRTAVVDDLRVQYAHGLVRDVEAASDVAQSLTSVYSRSKGQVPAHWVPDWLWHISVAVLAVGGPVDEVRRYMELADGLLEGSRTRITARYGTAWGTPAWLRLAALVDQWCFGNVRRFLRPAPSRMVVTRISRVLRVLC